VSKTYRPWDVSAGGFKENVSFDPSGDHAGASTETVPSPERRARLVNMLVHGGFPGKCKRHVTGITDPLPSFQALRRVRPIHGVLRTNTGKKSLRGSTAPSCPPTRAKRRVNALPSDPMGAVARGCRASTCGRIGNLRTERSRRAPGSPGAGAPLKGLSPIELSMFSEGLSRALQLEGSTTAAAT